VDVCFYTFGPGEKEHVSHDKHFLNGGYSVLFDTLLVFFPLAVLLGEKGVIPYFLTCFLGRRFWAGEGTVEDILTSHRLWFYVYTLLEKASV
jgi:hypothetical protein